jgi:hypothetical protein
MREHEQAREERELRGAAPGSGTLTGATARPPANMTLLCESGSAATIWGANSVPGHSCTNCDPAPFEYSESVA